MYALVLRLLCLAGIVFEAYAPIGSPGRFFKQDGDPDVMEDPVIKEIAGKHNVTPAQVTSNYTSIWYLPGSMHVPLSGKKAERGLVGL